MVHLLTNFAAECASRPSFLDIIPSWYKYLAMKKDSLGQCSIQFDLIKGGKFNGGDILLVGLGVIDILIRIAALVAVAFVIYGGIKYITSQGSPDGTKSAQNTILNAVLGLVISIVAAGVVAFLGNRLAQ